MHLFWPFFDTLTGWLASACLLRAYLRWIQIDLPDPIASVAHAVTDWLVEPLRRYLPDSNKLDVSSLSAALVLASMLSAVYVGLLGRGRFQAVALVGLLALVWLTKWSLFLASGSVLIRIILSWVNPYAPIGPSIGRISQPFVEPVQKLIPPFGGIDWSCFIFLILAELLLLLLTAVEHFVTWISI